MKGTRQYHRFGSVDLTTVRVNKLSEDREGEVVKVSRLVGTNKVGESLEGCTGRSVVDQCCAVL